MVYIVVRGRECCRRRQTVRLSDSLADSQTRRLGSGGEGGLVPSRYSRTGTTEQESNKNNKNNNTTQQQNNQTIIQ